MNNKEATDFYFKLKTATECPLCNEKAMGIRGINKHFKASHDISFDDWLTKVAPKHCKNCKVMLTGDRLNVYRIDSNYCSASCGAKVSSRERIERDGPPFKGEAHPLYGKKRPQETIEKMRIANTGKKHTEESKSKMRLWFKGNGGHPWKGRTRPQWVKDKQKIAQRKRREESWEGQFSQFCRHIRYFLYEPWTKKVLERDDYICQECGERGGKLSAHHIKPFRDIILEVLNKYLLLDCTKIEDKWTLQELCLKYPPLLDINNGKTLCFPCHRELHKNLVVQALPRPTCTA